MSSYDKAVAQLDELREQRKNLRVANIDFEQYMKAREADRASIKSPIEYQKDVAEFFNTGASLSGKTMPWEKTHGTVRFRPAEVSCWHGYNGHGKSQVLGQVISGLMQQGEKCCIASFEMHPYRTLARMLRQVVGNSSPSEQIINKYFAWANNKLWLYDQMGTVSGDRVIAVIYYVCETYGVTQFVIDSLMKCGIDTDTSHGTNTAQKNFVDRLCAVAKETNCHIHLVAHDKKPDDESYKPHKYMISGSGDISNQVDNCFGIWRNKRKEHDANASEADEDCLIICDKQRNGEWEGHIKLWFDKDSQRYTEAAREKVWSLL